MGRRRASLAAFRQDCSGVSRSEASTGFKCLPARGLPRSEPLRVRGPCPRDGRLSAMSTRWKERRAAESRGRSMAREERKYVHEPIRPTEPHGARSSRCTRARQPTQESISMARKKQASKKKAAQATTRRKKAGARRTGARRTGARQSSARKSSARKSSARRTGARKTGARKKSAGRARRKATRK